MKKLILLSALALVACESSPNAHRTTHVPVTKPRYNSSEPPTELRGFMLSNGAPAQNGAQAVNGFMLSNRLMLSNGFMLSNGLVVVDGVTYAHRQLGLDVDHPLSTEQGLSSQYGYTVHSAGQTFLKYLVECALGPNQYIVKGQKAYMGKVGLAPEWQNSGCGLNCQEWVTACLMARTNAQGASVMIDMRGTHPALTTAATPGFTKQEGAFWGNVFADEPTAYACEGADVEYARSANRLCTSGACAGIQPTEYRTCSSACAQVDGSFTWCPDSASEVAEPRIAVITTYLRP